MIPIVPKYLKSFLKLIIPVILILLSGCYYDNYEELYPELSQDCDTSNVTFAGAVAPVIQANCERCHNGSDPNGGVLLTTYEDIKAVADNGLLVQVTTSTNPDVQMPPGNPLPACDIQKITAWVEAGAPNN